MEKGTDKKQTGEKKVVGVRFRTAGKIYYFDPGDIEIKRAANVIVETARGVEFGTVVGDPMYISGRKINQPLKQVIRVATEEDREKEKANRAREREAFRLCQEKIRRHNLDMKLIDADEVLNDALIGFYASFAVLCTKNTFIIGFQQYIGEHRRGG